MDCNWWKHNRESTQFNVSKTCIAHLGGKRICFTNRVLAVIKAVPETRIVQAVPEIVLVA